MSVSFNYLKKNHFAYFKSRTLKKYIWAHDAQMKSDLDLRNSVTKFSSYHKLLRFLAQLTSGMIED